MAEQTIPDAALEADIATIAQKGAGKTYTNRGLVERLLDQNRRVVVMDPLSSWWGLKARADGSPGYPVAVVGGPHADVPLDPAQGEALGHFVASSNLPVVIDVSELKRGAMIRFSIDFLAALYQRNRDPLWLVLEEADVFAPQQPMNDATMLLHEVDQIARRGRARGFRLWTITQRPAKLHKDVLTQTSTLIMLRLRSPQDRAAAEEWIKGNAEAPQAREIVASLASLPVGEGWVWSPDQDLLARMKFPPIRTLDTSATPEHGAIRTVAGQLAAADVHQLRLALAAPAPGADMSRPADRETKAEMAARIRAAAGIEAAAFARGFSAGELSEWKRAQAAAQRVLDSALYDLRERIDAAFLDRPGADAGAPALPAPPLALASSPAAKAKARKAAPAAVAEAPQPHLDHGGAAILDDRLDQHLAQLSNAAANIITAARMAPRPVDWSEAALLAGMMPTGGYFNGIRRELKDALWGSVAPSNDMAADGPMYSDVELLEKFARKLTKGAASRVFSTLYVEGPRTKAQIADVLGMAGQGGYWNSTWKALRGSPLVVELDDKRWDVAPILRELFTLAHGGAA